MNKKTIFGWSLITVICSIPVFLWLAFGDGTKKLYDYGTITHSLGELFALVGVTMFALNFLLSTRIGFIEDIFGGLDKVYIAHGVLGGTALILLLFHPIFLVLKYIPSNIILAAQYLLPSSTWSVNFGIIALLGLIFLVAITLFFKMKYHRWKFTHEFLGLIFLIAVLHIFLVRGTASQDNIFDGYYYYAFFVSAIGLSSFFYSLVIKGRFMKNAVYSVSKIERLKDFFAISMAPEHKPIEYKSGQFIFLRFYNERLSRESHPFSIASKSNNPEIKVVIKKLGDYTEKLEHIKMGDKVDIEGPYGRFNYTNYKGRDMVWIAGGIGITPFLGMVQDIEDDKSLGSIWLFYSAKEDSQFVGYNLLKDVESRTKKFKFIPWNTGKKGYLTKKAIYDLSGKFKNKEFFLCGPPAFKESIIKQLREEGVPEEKIHEEAFDFR